MRAFLHPSCRWETSNIILFEFRTRRLAAGVADGDATASSIIFSEVSPSSGWPRRGPRVAPTPTGGIPLQDDELLPLRHGRRATFRQAAARRARRQRQRRRRRQLRRHAGLRVRRCRGASAAQPRGRRRSMALPRALPQHARSTRAPRAPRRARLGVRWRRQRRARGVLCRCPAAVRRCRPTSCVGRSVGRSGLF